MSSFALKVPSTVFWLGTGVARVRSRVASRRHERARGRRERGVARELTTVAVEAELGEKHKVVRPIHYACEELALGYVEEARGELQEDEPRCTTTMGPHHDS